MPIVAPYSGRASSELHLADRLLELAPDDVAELLALVGLEALHGGDDPGHDQRDQQDQRDVLHGALAAAAPERVEGSEQAGVGVAEGAVHLGPPVRRWTEGIVGSAGAPLQTRV